LDNAVAESFFSRLKKNASANASTKTQELARADIFDDIEVFYKLLIPFVQGYTTSIG